MTTQRKAIALISGGLDSMLAARIMQEHDIHVEGLNIFTGFCVEGHTHAIRNKDRKKKKRNNALWAAEQIGIKLHIVEAIEPYKQIVLNPRHGYGANLNPCLDCKGFMVGMAKEWMEENGFDFIVTGEVMGQRPKSQRRSTFPVVARESGAFDRLLRPLSAKLLPPTLPERARWVDREQLYELSGRSRRGQIELADRFGITEYSQPAGGCCFLTDEAYSRKLQDFWDHRTDRNYELDDIMLLKVGRHLRPTDDWKLIIARDAGETNYLSGYRSQFAHFSITSHSGPLTLVDGDIPDADVELAARVVARFGSSRDAERVDVRFTRTDGREHTLTVSPIRPSEIPEPWYV
ncbi:MAG: hypothetical protein OXI60_11710 [Acidiferrobacterales bacterium]|nr:hypothetical protein [Acidiferrobacterales bacterium]